MSQLRKLFILFFLISSPSLALYYSLSGFLVVLLWYLYSTGTGTRVLDEFDGKSLATGAVRPKGRFSVGLHPLLKRKEIIIKIIK